MAATPLLLITDVGEAAASVATPVGPFIHITGFKIGSAYGYTPTKQDTGLNGNILFTGVPIAYQYIGDNTINIICRIPADAGPFDFGEVGLYLDGDVLFAKMVFETPQQKLSSLGTNVISTYTFNCLLKLQQSVAVFKVDTDGPQPDVWTVDRWSDVYPAGISANPDIPIIVVKELDQAGNSSLLHQASDERWTIGTNYDPYRNASVVNGTATSVTLPQSAFPAGTAYMTTQANRFFVIEFADGFFRSVASVAVSGANYVFTLNPAALAAPPGVGSTVRVYRSASAPITWGDISGIPLATTTTVGIVRAGDGIEVPAAGVFAVRGLLHSGANTGRLLTGSDNLDSALPSGIYSANAGNLPAAWPPGVSRGGRINITNTNSTIVEEVWPNWDGSSASSPNSKNWWRIFAPGIGWSPWRSGGGLSGGQLIPLGSYAPGVSASGTFEQAGAIMAWNSGNDPMIIGYLNGTQVTAGDSNGGPEGITIVGYQGSSWSCYALRRTMYVYKVLLSS